MTFAILGPLEVRAGERCLALGGPRQVALLAFLLLHANRAVSSDQLHDTLWAEQGPQGAPKRVQMAIARLRKSLAALDSASDGGPVLRTVSGGYMLAVAAGELDAQVFQDRVTEGRALLDAGDPQGAAAGLRAALALWRGPALAEVAFADFAQAEIRRLDELRLAAIEARVTADLALGRHEALLAELEMLVAEHPGRERLCEQLMLALYRCGRQADALDAFHRVSSQLVGELGLLPGPSLQTLQRAVLEQASWLALDPGDAPGPADPQPGHSPAGAATTARPFALPAALQSGGHGPFVGRMLALEQLADSFGRAAEGARQLVLLRGEPGVGKTRLATEFARRVHDDGAVVLYGRCDEESLLPHQPFVEALRQYVRSCPAALLASQLQLISGELRRVVPELAERVAELAHPLAGDPEGARHRLFEAVGALLCDAAQDRPVVLLLEDLHWADTATLLLLKYVARYPRAARLMIIATYRESDVAEQQALRAVLTDLGREQFVRRLVLGRLDEGAVSELVSWHTGNRAPADVQRMIFEETEGLPFFVVEFSRHLTESRLSAPASDAGGGAPAMTRLPLPEGVMDLVASRLSHLGASTVRVLETAAVVGQAFAFELLEPLCDAGQDELVDALERAVDAQLIQEPAAGDDRYAFSHALIRDVLYGRLTAARRTLLHRRVAATLEQAAAADVDAHLAELAHHLGEAGGAADLDRAIGYAVRAGDHALAVIAYEQAATHYRHAIEMLDRRDAQGAAIQRCDVTIAQGEAERKAGNPAHRETLLGAAALAGQIGDGERLARAALANNRGFNSSSQGVDGDRVAVLQSALATLDDGDSAIRARLLAQLAVELIGDTDWQRRAQLADAALEMARRVGDASTLARVLTQVSVAQVKPGTLTTRIAQLQEARELADVTGDRLLAAQASYFGFNAALDCGDLARARALLEHLELLAEQLGQPLIAWYVAIAYPRLHMIVGSPKDGERLALGAYELGQRAGQPDALVFLLAHVYVLRLLQGTLAEGEPNLANMFASPGSSPLVGPEFTPSRSVPLLVAASMSAIHCEVGRLEDGRRHFELVMDEVTALPNDYSTLGILASAAIACGHLRDSTSARQLHDLLEPFADQFVMAGATGAFWLGAVRHHLAVLCATIDRPDDADAHFSAAERSYVQLASRPWLARCYVDWASALLERGGAGDPERASDLLAQALAIARELELIGVQKRAAALARRAQSYAGRRP